MVPGWDHTASEQDMYKYVVGTSCRVCHTARVTTAPQDLQFTQASDLIGYGSYLADIVCKDRVMPHSFRTYERFWTSINPHWPARFQAFGDTSAGGYGTICTFPPNNGQPSQLPP